MCDSVGTDLSGRMTIVMLLYATIVKTLAKFIDTSFTNV